MDEARDALAEAMFRAQFSDHYADEVDVEWAKLGLDEMGYRASIVLGLLRDGGFDVRRNESSASTPSPRFACPRGHPHYERSAFCTVCGAGPVGDLTDGTEYGRARAVIAYLWSRRHTRDRLVLRWNIYEARRLRDAK